MWCLHDCTTEKASLSDFLFWLIDFVSSSWCPDHIMIIIFTSHHSTKNGPIKVQFFCKDNNCQVIDFVSISWCPDHINVKERLFLQLPMLFPKTALAQHWMLWFKSQGWMNMQFKCWFGRRCTQSRPLSLSVPFLFRASGKSQSQV